MKQIWALVPVKDFACAKSRLAATLSGEARRALALAMALDVVTALRRARTVARVIVVSDIADVGRRLGVDGVGHFDTGRAAGLNEDLSAAAAWAATQGATHVVVAHADLPRLTPTAIDRFILNARDLPPSRLRAAACKEGSGTNLLLAPLPLPLPLVFGRDSLARFGRGAAAAGIALDIVHDAALAADIDEADDFLALTQACARGELAGRATAAFLLSTLPAPHDTGGSDLPDLLREWPAGFLCHVAGAEAAAIEKRAHV